MKFPLRILSACILFTAITFIQSCKKYEEGPMISLRSKKERVANSWYIHQKFVNGAKSTLTVDEENLIMTFQKNGAYYERRGSNDLSGIWQFEDNKQSISVDVGSYTIVYTILRLKYDEFWIKFVEQGTNDIIEYRLIQSSI